MFAVTQQQEELRVWAAVFSSDYMLWLFGCDPRTRGPTLSVARRVGIKLSTAAGRIEAARLVVRLVETLDANWKGFLEDIGR